MVFYNYKLLRGTIEELEQQMNILGNEGFSASTELTPEGFGIYVLRMTRNRYDKDQGDNKGLGPWPLTPVVPVSNGVEV